MRSEVKNGVSTGNPDGCSSANENETLECMWQLHTYLPIADKQQHFCQRDVHSFANFRKGLMLL